MGKFTPFLISRRLNQLFEQIVCKKSGNVGHPFGSHSFSSRVGIPDSRQNFTQTVTKNAGDRVYASYNVYKGKAGVSMMPCLPTFTKLDSGNLVISRRGSVMLTFFPAIGERKYDWTKKQLFSLSATEIGTLISLGPRDSCEFFHDPGMLSSTAGQVRKSLTIKSHADGNGYFISLNVVNNMQNTKEFLSVPFTAGEFSVMKTACSFALPHILGWDQLTRPSHQGMGKVVQPNKVDREALSLEWER
ncbi:single-stranded DNA-bindig protein WHY2, mitochondrial isoform X2 [Momordica charantia]|uniref:Single-stranded DNA-bindig protein WHY2, mitochondrial isoform X2 n=1 Tax=Momordica charantia TaxID=3673 RepID=A0A6J1DVW8_MOMCH|nr:single-stranded DNA-bindig protein WHY2, mitochondrial isoform X2 [Momordica charantia]